MHLTTLYIVRHGQSRGNIDHQLGKETPTTKLGSDLTSVGRQQVKALAQKLKSVQFDAIFSSPLQRAQRTAAMMAQDRQLAVLTKQALQERQKGNLGGKMESAQEAVTRFITALREIAVAYPGKTILVVTHGNVMRRLLVRLGYATFKQLLAGGVENTGYIKIATDGVDFFIRETVGVHKH